ncbi:transmembrane protein 254 [Brienomyrus brachyistius]|uniref:transmembrane protein 254 n=1 Tax=Brienomyrus brachyistius TaxID=42636 RepID=UPI0020B1A0F5|nr:transmembrane protein 254 [Brienomyrus brachyistius]
MARANDGAYFKRTSLFWMLTLTLSLGLYTWIVFWPDQVPYASMGPLGSFFQYLVKQHFTAMYYGWWLVWMIHISEAFYSQKLCRDKGVDSQLACSMWFVQTFLFGIASLGLLMKYKPDARFKRH